jgi:hypothetical protein
VAEAVEADLRNLGLVGAIMSRLAPGVETRALLSEVRERISDELDDELEAQHQRRLERRFRGHPHVRVARVHTDLCSRRVLVTDYVEGLGAQEIRGLAEAERDRVGEIVFRFYLPEPEAFEPAALLEHLATAGEWMLAPGLRRVDRDFVEGIVELGYPPRSPWFALMRRMRIAPPTLLLRRMELQVLSVLGELGAGGDWGAIAAEHYAAAPVSTALGSEDRAFFERRARR